jgi:PAS domain S-box-containing protein
VLEPLTGTRWRDDEDAPLADLFDVIAEPTLLLDRQARLEYVNRAFERLTGQERERLTSDPSRWWKSVRDEDRDWLRSAIGRACGGEEVRGDVVFEGAIAERPTKVRVCPFGDARRCVLTIHDTGTDARLQKQLAHLERKQADQLALLAGSLAHDLNNALTVLASLLDAAKPGERIDPELHKLSEGALRSAQALTQDLLTIGRGLRGEQLNPVKISTALKEVERALRIECPAHVRVEMDVRAREAWVMAETPGIVRVVVELVRFAVAAAPLDAHIRIAAVAGRSEVHLSIHLDFLPLPEDQLTHFFEPFSLLRNQTEQSGVGLTLVRALVTAYAGTLTAEPSADGAVFRLHLPRIAAPSSTPLHEDLPLPTRLLLVDDDANVRRSLARMLRRRGVNVVEADGGREALDLLNKDANFDAILVDIVMPKVDGFAMLRRLRRNHPDLPVVLMSGYSGVLPEDTGEGPTTFLAKPFRLGELQTAFASIAPDSAA